MPPCHERLIGNQQTARGVVQIAPCHPVIGLVRRVAVVPPQAQVHREAGGHFPIVLQVRREIHEVELARVAGLRRDAERGRLKDADAGVVAEQHVGDRVTGEARR